MGLDSRSGLALARGEQVGVAGGSAGVGLSTTGGSVVLRVLQAGAATRHRAMMGREIQDFILQDTR